VNAVTAGDYTRPVLIGKFLKELYSGFQLLNLKNDSLRKRFDGIKVGKKLNKPENENPFCRRLWPFLMGDSLLTSTISQPQP